MNNVVQCCRLVPALALAALLAMSGPAHAVAIAINANTNWSAIVTGSGPGGQPNASDTISVNNGATLTVNVTNGLVGNMQLGNVVSGGGNGTLSFSAADRAVTTGTITFGSTAGAGTRDGSIDMTNGGTLTVGGAGFVATSIGAWTPGTGTVVMTTTNTLPNNTNIDTFNNLTISAGTTTLSRDITINGNFNLAAGTLNMVGNAITQVNNGTVVINGVLQGNGGGGADFIKNGTGSLSGTGSINNVNQFRIVASTSVLAASSLTFTGANCRMDVSANATLTNAGTLTFNTASCGTTNVINLANPSTFANNGTVTVGAVVGTSNANSIWTQGANSVLNVSLGLVATGTLNASASLNTVNYSGTAAQTTKLPSAGDYHHLTFTNGGTKTLSAGPIDIAGNMTINAGAIVTGATNNPVVNLTGNFSNSGTYTSGTGQFTLQGTTGTQTVTGATTFSSLRINNTGAGVTVSNNITVTTLLTLTTGVVDVGANVVVLGTAATLTGGATASFIKGCVRKNFPADNTAPFPLFTFPIGTTGVYSPINFTFTAATTVGDVTACVTATDHPQVTTPIASTGIDAAKSVNRYWTLTDNLGGTGTPNGTYSATFNFVAADVDGGANTASFIVQRYDGTNWFPTTLGTVTGTSTQATGIAGEYGAFAVGEALSGVTPAPGAFNVFDTSTPAGASLGKLQTKIAGTPFAVAIVAVLNGAPNAGLNATFQVQVELLDSSNNTGSVSTTTACNTVVNWPSVQLLSTANLTFTAGRATLSNITVPQAYKDARIRVHFPVGPFASATFAGCSTDRFAIRPQSITTEVLDADWVTAGLTRNLVTTSYNGAPAHKAGRPFTVRTTPVPAATNYVTAGNHIGTPSQRTLTCTNPTTVGGPPPSPCTTCTNGTLTLGAFTGDGTRLTNSTATYSEAGTFNLDLHDTAFAAVDAVDGTPATYSNSAPIGRFVPQTATLAVGRFVPDNFLVATNNTPQFQTFGSACASRSFTYIGQPFGYIATKEPQALITAREAGGGTTTNYRQCLWKITTTSPSDVTQTYTNVAGPAIDTSVATNAPTIAPGNGTGTVTINSADRISYTRSLTTPTAPFNANITLGIAVRDNDEPDGQITSNTATFNGGGTGIPFDAGIDFRYGRARLLNALGSERLPLPIPIETQYWTGAGFATNALDSCTSLARSDFALSFAPPSNLVACETAVIQASVTMASGIGTMSLATPGVGNDGTVLITANLGSIGGTYCNAVGGATAAATSPGLSHLLGRWDDSVGTGYDDKPTSRAAFGLYGTQPKNFIFFRENY